MNTLLPLSSVVAWCFCLHFSVEAPLVMTQPASEAEQLLLTNMILKYLE